MLKLNGRTLETEAIFHQYVEPRVHKELTPFCTEVIELLIVKSKILMDKYSQFSEASMINMNIT